MLGLILIAYLASSYFCGGFLLQKCFSSEDDPINDDQTELTTGTVEPEDLLK